MKPAQNGVLLPLYKYVENRTIWAATFHHTVPPLKMCRTTSLTITRGGVGGREKKGSYTVNYYSQSDSCIVALLPSPQGRYWIQIQTTILDTNPTQAGSYRRQEQVRKRENDRGYGDRRLEREGENVGVMLRLECIPDKQLESLFDCDEGTY